VVRATGEKRQINGIAVETIEDLIIELAGCALIEALDVDFPEAIPDLSNLEPPRWRFS
jgi:hypothetical protein